MSRLADTQILLWAAYAPEKLSAPARLALATRTKPFFFSFASIWEIAIKMSLQKLHLPEPLPVFVAGLQAYGFRFLPMQVADAAVLLTLPRHHGDPFDRMLIAQAQQRGFELISSDGAFASYGVKVVW